MYFLFNKKTQNHNYSSVLPLDHEGTQGFFQEKITGSYEDSMQTYIDGLNTTLSDSCFVKLEKALAGGFDDLYTTNSSTPTSEPSPAS